MTSQVNLVRPGGKAQTCHRDYHLGFMTPKQAENFPKHAHLLSMSLTLQGAIAHCDMPIESGPTKLLPNSQRYNAGYIATLLPSFRQIFEENYIQIPLEKGDMLFLILLFFMLQVKTSQKIFKGWQIFFKFPLQWAGHSKELTEHQWLRLYTQQLRNLI